MFLYTTATSTAVLIFCSIAFVWWYLFIRRKARLPPGPKPWPIFGNLAELRKQKNFHEYLFKLAREYGPIYTLYIGTTPNIIVCNIEVANELLLKKIDQFADRPTTYALGEITEGKKDIFSQNYGDFVKFHRRIIRTVFRNSMMADGILEKMTHLAIMKGAKMMDRYAETKEKFCPKDLVVKIVYSCFSQLILNRNFELDDPDLHFLSTVLKRVFSNAGNGFVIDLAPWFFKHLPRFGAFKKATDLIHELCMYFQKDINEHRKTYDEANLRSDVIDHLTKVLADENVDLKQFNDLYFRQSLIEIFSGGADSNIGTLYWILLWLTNNPHVQDKMAEEIHKHVGRDRFPSIADKNKLKYCEAVMLEGMRVAPAVPLNIRCPAQDAKLAGYDIPKGTQIIVNHYAIHFDPNEWDRPNEFLPERFLSEDGEVRGKNPRSFLPFSAGRRVCIGEGVAKLQIFCILAGLMQNYKFIIPDGLDKVETNCVGGLVVHAGEFEIQVEKRK